MHVPTGQRLMDVVAASFAFLAASTASAVTSARSQAPTEGEVRNWLMAEVQRAAEPYIFGDFYVSWRAEDFNTLAPDEVAALRAEVAGKPEHPRLSELNLIEAQIAKGSSNIRYRLFSNGTSGWRFCRDGDMSDKTYLDTVWAPNGVWKLSEQSLGILPATRVTDETFRRRAIDSLSGLRDQPIVHDQNVFRPMLDRILFGGLDPIISANLVLSSLTVTGDSWTAEFTRDPRANNVVKYKFSGRWDRSQMRGFIEERRMINTANGSIGDVVERYLDWSSHNPLQRPIAQRADLFRPSGKRWRSLVLVEVDRLPAAGFDAIVAPPSPQRLDAIRGSIASHTIIDLIADTKTTVSSEGVAVTEKLSKPVEQSPENSTLRIAGWVLAALLLFAVLLLRARRS